MAERVPSQLNVFFWDVDPASLDAVRHAEFIIERLLEYGDAASVAWLCRRYAVTDIRAVVASSPRLSPKTATAWARHLGLREESVRSLHEPSRTTSWRS